MSELNTSFYLVLSGAKRGYTWRELKAKRIVQKTASLPKLEKDEIAIRVEVRVPSALFDRPELTVSIAVDGGLPRAEITAETLGNLAERIQELVGTPVHVTCDLPEAS